MPTLGRDHYPAPPAMLATADEAAVEAADLLFDYETIETDISPDLAVARIRALVDSPAGAQAYLTDVLEAAEMTNASDVVVNLVTALDMPGADAGAMIERLRGVLQAPLAVEVYNNEMDRRAPRDAARCD